MVNKRPTPCILLVKKRMKRESFLLKGIEERNSLSGKNVACRDREIVNKFQLITVKSSSELDSRIR